MKKFVLNYINLSILISALSVEAYALESMDDEELSSTTGEGIGAIVDNLSIHSGDKGSADGFDIIVDLNNEDDPTKKEQFIFSELRIHKTGTVSGDQESGGNFGTVNNPVFVGDLRSVDIYSGNASNPLDKAVTTSTVMRSEFPGASLRQVDRSNKTQQNNFSRYQAAADRFESDLDQISDKFNLHLRFDDVIGSPLQNFRSIVDVEGFRFYGTYSDLFATAGNGISLAGATGLYIDTVTISSELPTAGSKSLASAELVEFNRLLGLAVAAETAYENDSGNLTLKAQAIEARKLSDAAPTGYVTTPEASQLSLNGIDIYSVLGTKDQPLTLKSVQVDGKNQLQMEIAPLPSSIGVAPKSDIYIKSIYFGDKYNPALRTGLRAGKADDGTPENYHYAFQPDVGNTIEIRGMSIQHLRITTLDI